MLSNFKSLIYSIIIILFFWISSTQSEIVKNIVIEGNNRISDETILMFSKININQEININTLNSITKNLYDTNFFDNISVSMDNNILKIFVVEFSIIQNININGIKSDPIKDEVFSNLELKSRSSFNPILLKKDINTISSKLKELGYFFSKVDVFTEDLEDNKVNINYEVNLGDKAKIKKISFIGNKIFKDNKLKSIIVSEEYKFWKFISGKKYLNENVIDFDKRLLRNFYLNKGYYNVIVDTSFAKLLDEDEFELIFNIDSKNKVYFGELNLKLPINFEKTNYENLNKIFNDIKNKPYSINLVEKILDEIDILTINEEFQSVKASVVETIINDKINLDFVIEQTDVFFVERINIFGNNVTRESVIRNQLEIDEGDPFNEILQNKSVNKIKSLNFFKEVNSEIVSGSSDNYKIINLTVQEKPTGEISAGAGVGTSGSTLFFGIKENNYLGKGLGLNADLTLSTESVKGSLTASNPNYNNSDKSIFGSLVATETDSLDTTGFKNNKFGFEAGTNFEYFDDFVLGLSNSNFYEEIDVASSASVRKKRQAGDFYDSFLNLEFDYDKRNQKFKTNDGFRSVYSIKLPIISDTDTLTNSYEYKYFTELYENNITNFSIGLSTANSISGKDIKLSERLFIPGRNLRGFEIGKLGPKDGNDFIGGNLSSSFNASTTLPKIFENNQNLDVLLFFDAANLWKIDYDASLNDGNQIRTSLGVGVDWTTPVGPLSFSLAQPLTKSKSDITETFRFNIGTSF